MPFLNLYLPSKTICFKNITRRIIDNYNYCLVNVATKKTIAEELGLPEPPKRPLTPYLKFFNVQRIKLKELYPCISNADNKMIDCEPSAIKLFKYWKSVKKILIKAGKLWGTLDEKEKKVFADSYEIERAKYLEDYEKYEMNLLPSQIEEMKSLKLRRTKEKKAKLLRKEQKKISEELGKPKFPGTAFNLFLSTLDRGEASFKEFLVSGSTLWAKLPVEKQNFFKAKAKELRDDYEQRLLKWEHEMVEGGHADLVRKLNVIPEKKGRMAID